MKRGSIPLECYLFSLGEKGIFALFLVNYLSLKCVNVTENRTLHQAYKINCLL